MSYIRKVSDFARVAVSQESLTEGTHQPTSSQPQINTGIANTADEFVAENPSDLYGMIQQQTAPMEYDKSLHRAEEAVDPSSLFNFSRVSKEESKDIVGRLTDAMSEGEKVEKSIEDALDYSNEIRKP
ncbi:hypothetical protein L0244_41045 [bacterium]|nr:hypothetical protein [bacterium]